MDEKAELNRFAEMLLQLVRDEAISDCDALAAGGLFGPPAPNEAWRKLRVDQRTRETCREVIPDIVDQVLFRLLHALDQGDIPLAWQHEDGSCTSLYDLGRSEMAGWFGASDPDGWRPRYSKRWRPL